MNNLGIILYLCNINIDCYMTKELYQAFFGVIAILLSFLPLSVLAQNEEAGFTADRPGVITGPDVLPKGRLQWEMGMGYQQVRQNGTKSYIWTLNTTLLRFGISDYAELRLQGDWNNEGGDIFDYSGSDNVAIGAKAKLFDGWKFVPAVSLLGNVIIPSNSNNNMPNNWSGQMGLLCQNQLTPWLSLGYEGDLTWFDSEKPIIFYGANLGFTLNDRWQLMVEEYNYKYPDSHDNWMELGIIWQLSRRVQIDVNTDIYLNDFKSFWSIAAGISWQITKR